MSLLGFRINYYGHRPVIQKRDFHISSKNTFSDRFSQIFFENSTEFPIKRCRYIRFRRPDIGGPVAAGSRSIKRELADA